MKANTNRDGRFNFDAIADAYEDARLIIPTDLIADISSVAGFRAPKPRSAHAAGPRRHGRSHVC